uniref:Uncharacterized protein n=1 Tax=Candidatus Kentrum sp. LFY TaxID=2126342 RepID=A0A450V7K5_9GAMM|nr:MAG: hypothetical protein BECKLFY1418A_GA0070994_11261 [Candidatus Kentron sp. LFY]
MNPTLVIWGIQATLRAAQAGANLYGEHARDRKIYLPDLELPEGNRRHQVGDFLDENRGLIGEYPALKACWNNEIEQIGTKDIDKIDAAYAVILEHEAKRKLTTPGSNKDVTRRDAKIFAGGAMIEQWRKDRQPPSPFIRFALTLTDIGLEFVAANPSILGASSRGEKLIVAFATKLSDLIPNELDKFGPKVDFADRVFGIFLRAGLTTLTDNANVVFRDEDIAELVAGIAMPVVEALPNDIASQIDYRELVDALAGPAAAAAFKLLAENTEGYLGRNFADNKALGAVTSALFTQIEVTSRDSSIAKVFNEQGIIDLYKAALGVAIERPALFIGSDSKKLFKDLLSGTVGVLQAHPRLKGPINASFASMVVTAVGGNAPMLLKLDPRDPWETVAIRALGQVTDSLSEALDESNGSIKGALKTFSDGQLLELGRIVLEQAAKTPGMLGANNVEVRAILSGMAAAMAADDNLLLSADEWIEIAAVAAEQAAANPGRLFSIDTNDPENALAVTLIKSVLEVANDAWSNSGGRTGDTLLFGETLHTAIDAVLYGLAGNISGATNNTAKVDQFLNDLLQRAKTKPEKFGSEGLMKVFTALVGNVLADGVLPTEDKINEALAT